jgi:hypothetical protein
MSVELPGIYRQPRTEVFVTKTRLTLLTMDRVWKVNLKLWNNPVAYPGFFFFPVWGFSKFS